MGRACADVAGCGHHQDRVDKTGGKGAFLLSAERNRVVYRSRIRHPVKKQDLEGGHSQDLPNRALKLPNAGPDMAVQNRIEETAVLNRSEGDLIGKAAVFGLLAACVQEPAVLPIAQQDPQRIRSSRGNGRRCGRGPFSEAVIHR